MTTTMTTTTKTIAEQFAKARGASVPLIVTKTVDPQAVLKSILDLCTESKEPALVNAPIVQWDAAAGFVGRNKLGKQALVLLNGEPDDDNPNPNEILNPADAMHKIRKIAKLSIVFVFNAHKIWHDLTTMQAIWNLRDEFKNNERTLILSTTPEALVARELEADVMTFNDPLPNAEQIKAIIVQQCKNAGAKVPQGDDMQKAVDAMKGLGAFTIEQNVAISLRKNGPDMEELWRSKVQAVEQTPGAKVYKGNMTFASIGGHDGMKRDLQREIKAKRPVKVVVILDEFEKMIAGASSDHVGDGGVAKDSSMVVLTNMQDHGHRGLVAFGHPGTGKTALAKAMAAEADCLCIMADMGAMKAGHVGESEARVRQFFNMVNEIAGDGGAFFFATCNGTGAITAELRRRFKTGFYFIDLPTREEKDAIWSVHIKGFALDAKQKLPNDDLWTGSDIEVCCEKADNYGISLLEAAESIVPGALSQPELVKARQREAHCRMLSSQTGRTFRMPEPKEEIEIAPTAPSKRAVRFNN
jgi:hypothetical protein